MSTVQRIIQPSPDCSACGERFVQGDRAVEITYIPEGESQTVCLGCYGTMLAAAVTAMQKDSHWPLSRINQVLRGFVDNENGKNDSGVIPT